MKKSERQKTLTAFQKLRRLQECDDNGYCKCISCGKIDHYKNMDGGHYINRECRATELDHDNVWPQCKQCNKWKSGNNTLYQFSLLNKIGIERRTRLEMMQIAYKGNTDIYNTLSDDDKRLVIQRKSDYEYKELTKKFNAEIREILREKRLS